MKRRTVKRIKKTWGFLLLSILVAHAAGIIGSVATSSSLSTWYQTLALPSWNPPNWLFGPVWLTLYTLMGIAAYMIWLEKKSSKRDEALVLYGSQLVLNTIWSLLFFGAQNPGLAFGEIIILLGLIILTTRSFFRLNRTAGWLMVPYIAWVSFATILNGTIWYLNP